MTNKNDIRMVAFSPDLLEKGYKLIYRNGQRPDDHKVWPDGMVSTYHKDGLNRWHSYHNIDGICIDSKDFDLFLTPPEMYVGVNPETNNVSSVVDDINGLRSLYGNSLTYYRLVPVE